MFSANVQDEEVIQAIHKLVEQCGGDPHDLSGKLISQMIQTNLRMIQEKHDLGQLKLISRSVKEMRYAYRIFNKYKENRCVSIFGSARTPSNHPDYIAAQDFSAKMASYGWMCMTGAANGIMRAGLEGPKRESCFGLSIRLPFESEASYLEGDAKLISFRYFFTRKLMFTSHSDALAAFPGGFGTMDELFEMLTLQQTGKASIVPIVLIEGEKGQYWNQWEKYMRQHLLKNGWISPEDRNFYYIAKNPESAVAHIQKFYSRYHSSRYVHDMLVIRINTPLTFKQIGTLNLKFKSLIASGHIEAVEAYPEETDHLLLPRIAFHHTHRDFGIVRALIDEINNF